MPVTPAHAAAAWPLKKVFPRLPLSALVIGTMSPDYEYFLRLAPITRVAHTLAGFVFFCLPVSIAVWWVFRRLVRPALVELLPPGLARQLGPASTSWTLAFVAVTLGALSHIAWDGFTHQNDWAVRALPLLRSVPLPTLLPLPWYKLLQYASSVAGLALVATWVVTWIRAQPARALAWPPTDRRHALIVVGLVLIASAIGAVADSLLSPRHTWQIDLGRAAVGAMVGCSASAVAYAVIRRATAGRVLI